LLRAATTELSSSTWSAARTTQDDPLTSSFKFNLTKNHKIKDNKVGLSQHNREALHYLYLHLSLYKLCTFVKRICMLECLNLALDGFISKMIFEGKLTALLV